jgi:hypothetical protein
MHEQPLRIAVAGAGVAGIVAAYLLSRRHYVTLYESNDYIGGHTNTVAVPDGKGGSVPVDTGFIVFNDRTYPLFSRFLEQLEVRADKTDMSFSYADERSSLQYASQDLGSIFAQRKNLFRPSFLRFLAGLLRFNRITRLRLHEGALSGITLDSDLEREGFGDALPGLSCCLWPGHLVRSRRRYPGFSRRDLRPLLRESRPVVAQGSPPMVLCGRGKSNICQCLPPSLSGRGVRLHPSRCRREKGGRRDPENFRRRTEV